jgi:hypothetical protein
VAAAAAAVHFGPGLPVPLPLCWWD